MLSIDIIGVDTTSRVQSVFMIILGLCFIISAILYVKLDKHKNRKFIGAAVVIICISYIINFVLLLVYYNKLISKLKEGPLMDQVGTNEALLMVLGIISVCFIIVGTILIFVIPSKNVIFF